MGDCWTLLEIFEFIKDVVENDEPETILDVSYKRNELLGSGNGFVFDIVPINLINENYYEVNLYANQTTIENCMRGCYEIRKKEDEFTLKIAIVNPHEFCPEYTNKIVSPQITGQAIVLLGIMLGLHLNVKQIKLIDAAKTDWDDLEYLRHIAYVKECQSQNNRIIKIKPFDCYSYYKQFGFRDKEQEYIEEGPCFDEQNNYKNIANKKKDMVLNFVETLECFQTIKDVVLNTCIVVFLNNTKEYFKELKENLKCIILQYLKDEDCA